MEMLKTVNILANPLKSIGDGYDSMYYKPVVSGTDNCPEFKYIEAMVDAYMNYITGTWNPTCRELDNVLRKRYRLIPDNRINSCCGPNEIRKVMESAASIKLTKLKKSDIPWLYAIALKKADVIVDKPSQELTYADVIFSYACTLRDEFGGSLQMWLGAMIDIGDLKINNRQHVYGDKLIRYAALTHWTGRGFGLLGAPNIMGKTQIPGHFAQLDMFAGHLHRLEREKK